MDKELLKRFVHTVDLYRRGGASSIESTKPYNLAAKLGRFLRDWDRHTKCAVGNHVANHYCSGYAPHKVHWICGRCQQFRHWGWYNDGPTGPEVTPATIQEENEWREEHRLKWEEVVCKQQDVEGECNARWSTSRCTRPLDHEGDHGIQMPGFILAPWPNERVSAHVSPE